MLANNSLKNGGFLWNWSIDLGSSFVGALGFYVLGSPFAWLSFLFPAEFTLFLDFNVLILFSIIFTMQ